VQKVLAVRSEHVALRFSSSVAKYLDDVYHQRRPHVDRLPEVGVGRHREEGDGHVQL
jgi:hypothetical protein